MDPNKNPRLLLLYLYISWLLLFKRFGSHQSAVKLGGKFIVLASDMLLPVTPVSMDRYSFTVVCKLTGSSCQKDNQ